MPERSSILQGLQLGVETTPGTGVAANKSFSSIGIGAAVSVDMQRFRPMGSKFATVVTPGKEWTESKIEGVGSYTELTYLLASVLKDPGAPTTVDTTARLYTFVPASKAEDTVKTYTIEQGGSVRAHKWSYGIVTDLSLEFTRDGIDVAGTVLGQRLQDGITLTGAPTAIQEKPMLPTDVDVYLDTSSAGLGTTKLTRVLKASIKIGSRFNPVWVLNTANTSFVATVEGEPDAEIEITVEADSAGMALLTTMRNGTTQFLRIASISPDLAGSATAKYQLIWDAAVKIKDVSDFSDEDGVYAITWTLEMVHDGTWAKAMTVGIQNQLTAL